MGSKGGCQMPSPYPAASAFTDGFNACSQNHVGEFSKANQFIIDCAVFNVLLGLVLSSKYSNSLFSTGLPCVPFKK